ncbi:MAG: hypothetical protein MZV70_41880 [Desulfobacterales bacterium]|nr:hypothetical protein [Desulfobacterales bacterium]
MAVLAVVVLGAVLAARFLMTPESRSSSAERKPPTPRPPVAASAAAGSCQGDRTPEPRSRRSRPPAMQTGAAPAPKPPRRQRPRRRRRHRKPSRPKKAPCAPPCRLSPPGAASDCKTPAGGDHHRRHRVRPRAGREIHRPEGGAHPVDPAAQSSPAGNRQQRPGAGS